MSPANPSPSRIIGVVGTGTEVGKSIVTASLARAMHQSGFRVGVFKPFACDPARRASGEGFSTDADLLARAAGGSQDARESCGQLFSAPLAPLAAARAEGRRVRPDLAIRQARRISRSYDLTLVEGCGGWEVPLTIHQSTADFFAKLNAPLLIVALSGLGTINHTLLTLQAIRNRNLPVLGIILNRTRGGRLSEAERTNPATLRRMSRLPVWGPVPYRAASDNRRLDRIPVEALPRLTDIAKAVQRQLDRKSSSGVSPK